MSIQTIITKAQQLLLIVIVFCVGSEEGLRAAWQQLALVKKDIGFRYIRIHGLLQDDMQVYAEDTAGNAVYNFQYVDRLYDFFSKHKGTAVCGVWLYAASNGQHACATGTVFDEFGKRRTQMREADGIPIVIGKLRSDADASAIKGREIYITEWNASPN